ncbi:hypothetical protein SNE510_00190 [Streptomyces sp. NE5-10]|nr:hypothetical protein SNE510_00190 [Streptomyces sp. NE5-10]
MNRILTSGDVTTIRLRSDAKEPSLTVATIRTRPDVTTGGGARPPRRRAPPRPSVESART